MIVKEDLTINGKAFVKQFSDKAVYIEREGQRYSEAIDPANLNRQYAETDILIPRDENDALFL